MAETKTLSLTLRLSQWAMLLLALIAIPTAIYAITTWNDSPSSQRIGGSQSRGSQLPGQSNMQTGLQGQPANTQELGGSAAQLQPSGTTQSPQPPDSPTSCPPPGVDMACVQY